MSRPESPRTAAIRALFADCSVLTARDVADATDTSVQIATACLHRLWTRGRLARKGRHGNAETVGYLYLRPEPKS